MKNLLHREGLPGECIYSLVARACISSPHLSWKQTNIDIFGKEYVRVHTSMPGHLWDISKFTGASIDELRIHSTAHPLVAFGLLSPSSRIALVNSEHNGNASKVIEASRFAASKLSFGYQLKCCPGCIERDESYFGMPYWHIVHQLPGVTVCPRHKLSLCTHKAGDGGINHQYVLPLWEDLRLEEANPKALYLSNFIISFYRLLKLQSPIVSMSRLYKEWLDAKGFVTANGQIRWRFLRPMLKNFWGELYTLDEGVFPLELLQFQYVPKLIHHDKPTHYMRHIMLMAFLCSTPSSFLYGPEKRSNKPKVSTVNNRINPVLILDLIDQGVSMRSIAAQYACSIGFIKSLALRNNREVERRRKFITRDIERSIWRKAFIGLHRSEIAEAFGISIGAVEQIIQSHAGLSYWRHHIKMQDKKVLMRKELKSYLLGNPQASRNQIKKMTKSYMWLYKHDKEWLYENLPATQKVTRNKGINWQARDVVLVAQMMSLKSGYLSLSALDRELGAHGWLLKYKSRLPNAMDYATRFLIQTGSEYEH